MITPNRSGPPKERSMPNITSDRFQYEDDNVNDHVKHSFSYNDTIRGYELNLLGPTKITRNHLLTISPSYADVKDGFGRIILHPETALSALIFFYKNKKDRLPILNLRQNSKCKIKYGKQYSM